MKSYVMVVLKTGPAEAGELVLAGPFMNADDKRGLYIFNVTEIADAEALVEMDPAVMADIFLPEYTQYYGSAALRSIQDLHTRIQRTKIE